VQAGRTREGSGLVLDGCVALGAAVHADLVDVERAIAAVSLTPPPRSILHAFVFSTCANVMGTWLAAVWWGFWNRRRHCWAMRRRLNSRGALIAGMRVAFVSLVSEAVCAMCAICVCVRVTCVCGWVGLGLL